MTKNNINTSSQPLQREIKPGAYYRHYKGNLYKVIALAHDSEDPTLLRVVYQALYMSPSFGLNSIWVRPYTMFAEKVEIDGKLVDRFEEVQEKHIPLK